ncbi:MAG TPA: alpha/beta hydrolase, partial [Bacteroidales bacterium]|nr:alpha/beta hydrolase [Bacteroidales bacterium]
MIKKQLFFSILAILLTHSVFSQNSSPFTGYWYGMLEFMGSELIITLDISADSEANLTGMLHSPLQGANNIPITKLTTRGDSVYIEVKSMSAKIAGKLSDDGNKFDAVFTQAVFTIPMQFERTEELFSLKRPQEPKPPFDYTSEDIFFENTKAGIRLAGTITYPKGEGPFPAVVLISGSGPQDRNEEIFGHKPFLVIADYLTSRGIAVLRYDDRGVAQSKGDFA